MSDPDSDPAPEPAPEDPAPRPLYKRPGIMATIIVFLLLMMVILPPVIAQPTPVGLSDEGAQNAQDGGWVHQEDGPDTMSLFAGFVVVDPVQFEREENGITTGMFLFSSVKIGAMLPQGIVSDRLHDAAMEQIADSGVKIQLDTQEEGPFSANGQEMAMRTYTGTVENGVFGELDPGTKVDLFVATWRCSLLGSHAVAVGAAPHDDGEDGNDTLLNLGSADERSEGSGLHQIRDDLLAHTVCDP